MKPYRTCVQLLGAAKKSRSLYFLSFGGARCTASNSVELFLASPMLLRMLLFDACQSHRMNHYCKVIFTAALRSCSVQHKPSQNSRRPPRMPCELKTPMYCMSVRIHIYTIVTTRMGKLNCVRGEHKPERCRFFAAVTLTLTL